jgi:DNA polymerase III subunit gamma/tau
VDWDGRTLRLALAPSLGNLRVAGAEQRLGAALAAALGREVALCIDSVPASATVAVAQPAGLAETPAGREARQAAARVTAAEVTMAQDPVATELKRRLGADWVPGSIRPLA